MRPTPTPINVSREGRSPARSRKRIIHSGKTEAMRAAMPVGTYLTASVTIPIATPRIVTPINIAPRTCGAVTVNARGPLTSSTIVPKSREAAIKRVPDPKSGGIDLTMRAMPVYVEPQTIQSVIKGPMIMRNGASVTPRISGSTREACQSGGYRTGTAPWKLNSGQQSRFKGPPTEPGALSPQFKAPSPWVYALLFTPSSKYYPTRIVRQL